MNFLRQHWFDLGIVIGLIVGFFLVFHPPSPISILLWISLISLFLHQFEEYRYPGYFPGMMNTVMFSSQQPDRYPLNPNTALIINILVGWLFYFLAALFGERAVWLGIATMLVSAGNFIAHTFLFNIKGKTFYNPGMLTADIVFLPIAIYFFVVVLHGNLATPLDWGLGIVLGIALNYLGILKMIDLLKDANSMYIFPKRFLPPESKKN
ncbi:MAG: HXXEE domain-containing protein [Anaerolineales bacterium]|jgi:hypothetical protein